MTMPHLSNCPHSGDGWCLSCVKAMHEEHTAALAKYAAVCDFIDRHGDSIFNQSFVHIGMRMMLRDLIREARKVPTPPAQPVKLTADQLKKGAIYRMKKGDFAEFSGIGSTGKAIFHPPGEPGMQCQALIDQNCKIGEDPVGYGCSKDAKHAIRAAQGHYLVCTSCLTMCQEEPNRVSFIVPGALSAEEAVADDDGKTGSP